MQKVNAKSKCIKCFKCSAREIYSTSTLYSHGERMQSVESLLEQRVNTKREERSLSSSGEDIAFSRQKHGFNSRRG